MTHTGDPYHTEQEDTQERQHIEATYSEQERLRKLSLEISTALIAGKTSQEMLRPCTESLVRYIDAAFARIWILNEEEQILELQASSGMYTHLNGEHARVPVGALKIGLIAAERKPHLTNRVIGDPRVNDQEWAQRQGMVSFAGYPLLVGKRLVGVMALFARHQLNDTTLQAMATIANSIALGVERLNMLEERERLLAREQAARKEAEVSLQRLQELNVNLEAMVTERTEILTQLNTELERSNQELQDFAYVASHDLQEPLRKIQAFGNLLEEEYGESLGDGKTYLDRMRNAAGRMRVLIDDLLTFSRVTTKAQPFSLVNLNEVVEQVIDDLGPRIQMTQGIVEVGELPTIKADSQQMYHMFQNLLSNALKFHKPGVPPVVKVTAQVRFDPETVQFPAEEQYLLSIEDNGIGFDEKYLDRIFTVFQRLHGRSDYEGTGIGLAVVRKIVERHGGAITAKSAVGEGATFLVTLPMQHH
jgi:signal transduction histidine kinase